LPRPAFEALPGSWQPHFQWTIWHENLYQKTLIPSYVVSFIGSKIEHKKRKMNWFDWFDPPRRLINLQVADFHNFSI
jgi:hypothetical protein